MWRIRACVRYKNYLYKKALCKKASSFNEDAFIEVNSLYFMTDRKDIESKLESLPFVNLGLDHRTGRFIFRYDPLSSALPQGNYTIDGDVLTCEIDGSGEKFCFRIIKDGMYLQFMGGESDPVLINYPELGDYLEDGIIFYRRENGIGVIRGRKVIFFVNLMRIQP